jgi:hypothetical protein
VVVVLAVLVVVLGATLFLGRRHHVVHVVHGSFPISGGYLFWSPGGPCLYNGSPNGTPNKGPIRPGTPVTVTDSGGKIISTGAIEGGTASRDGMSCTFNYNVTVPDRSIYEIQVSDWPPSVVTKSQLAANHWRVAP